MLKSYNSPSNDYNDLDRYTMSMEHKTKMETLSITLTWKCRQEIEKYGYDFSSLI